MKTISNMEEYDFAIQKYSVVIFVTKSEMDTITNSNLMSDLESAIPAQHKLLCEFYLADIESIMEAAMSLEIIGTPAIAAFSMGELIKSEVYSDPGDFDGWNEDELFDFSNLPVCLNEFLESLG